MTTYLIYSEFLFLVLVGASAIAVTLGNDSCWLHENLCNVKAEIYQNLEFLNGVPMQIDCSISNDSDTVEIQLELENNKTIEDNHHHEPITTSSAYSLQRRFMGIQSVMLDGCQTTVNTQTFGLEFLPICLNVTKVALEHFHMDTLMPLQCGSAASTNQQMDMEYLIVKNNQITSVNSDSFTANLAHLRLLEMDGNSLKTIEENSFHALRSLEHLRIVNEPLLILNSADIFEYTAVIAIHLEALKHMTSEIFHHLPETIESFYVAYTLFDSDAVDVNNARSLVNLTITNCALERFSFRDIHSTVKTINLNGNVLKSFEAYENNVRELDLSNNQLEFFDYKWAECLNKLEVLSLKENHIKSVNIYEILKALPNGRSIDMRANRLQALTDADKEYSYWMTSQLRLRCDRNPWDCLWLHEFAHSHPEKFRILQYDKFISKINVNGLECTPAEKFNNELNKTNTTSSSAPHRVMNASTYHLVYGDPYDFRRNQRAEALIIVFMLPVGIAFLFLLLYMWIYCQKVFHVSYYKNISWMHRHPSIANTAQRFDVVRQMPPQLQQTDSTRPLTILNDQDDGSYEVPLNGLCSECNCKTIPNTLGSCNKAIHITYEESPADVRHQIYEEITSVSDNEFASDEDSASKSPYHSLSYDHLRFD